VAPPEAVNETLPQAVMVPLMLAVGIAFTVTDSEAVDEQPCAEVTVTVYEPELVNVLDAVDGVLPADHR